jgi:DNA end-binding protein Ku
MAANGSNRKPATAWKGMLSFGLLTIPVKAYTGAREERISFNQICRAHHQRVKCPTVCPGVQSLLPEEVVPEHAIENKAEELLKGYEVSKGHFIYIDPKEIEALEPESGHNLEITEFLDESQVDPLWYEKSYYLAPEEGGHKPYHLLRTAMRETQRVGIAKVVMYGSEHVVLLRAYEDGMLLHTLYWESEIRQISFPELESDLNAKEIEVAKQMIGMLSTDEDGNPLSWNPSQFKDEYTSRLRQLIDAKVAGTEMEPIPEPPKKAPQVDIMSALMASMEQARAKKKAA